MGDELRDRFFTPFVLPLAVIGVMLLFGISLARILMAVSELGAAFVALLAAGYIMAMAFFVEARTRITARALGIALAIGLIGLIGAGAVASAAGMRELEHHGEGEEGAAAGGEGEGGGEAAASDPVFVAIDIAYESAPAELPADEEIEVQLVNEGAILHNVVIEERADERILEAEAGQTDSAAITLEAGDYTYYCDVPGHRSAGMEGTLTAAEGVDVGGGGDEAAAPVTDEEAPAEGASEGIGEPSELGS